MRLKKFIFLKYETKINWNFLFYLQAGAQQMQFSAPWLQGASFPQFFTTNGIPSQYSNSIFIRPDGSQGMFIHNPQTAQTIQTQAQPTQQQQQQQQGNAQQVQIQTAAQVQQQQTAQVQVQQVQQPQQQQVNIGILNSKDLN